MSTVAAAVAIPERPTRRLFAVGALAVLGGVTACLTAMDVADWTAREPDGWSLLRGSVVAVYVGVGAYTSWRRPEARFGLYLTGIGLLFAVASLGTSSDAPAHTVGRVTFAAFIVCLAYVYLCFPRDHLGSRLKRRVIAVLATTTAAMWLPTLLLVERLPAAGPLTDCGGECPANPLQLVNTPHALSSAISFTVTGITALGIVVIAAVLLPRAGALPPHQQLLVLPLVCCVTVQAVNFAAYSVLRELDYDNQELVIVGALSALAIPVAMLVGHERAQVFLTTSLGELVTQVSGHTTTPTQVETLLRETLGDPRLQLALWEPYTETYVDVAGQPVEPAAQGRHVKVTWVRRGSRPFAAVSYRRTVEEGDGVAAALAATALTLLENTRLVEELRASLTRVAASEQRERLRLERNLHDGAQQRLFAIQIKLEAAREETKDEALVRELDDIAQDVAAAVDELRTLAHGLYPTILRERGLADGLRSIAHRAPIRVRVVDNGIGRLSDVVEEAVYFCAREAVQNATKHAGRGAEVVVTLSLEADGLVFTIADDGVGFDQTDGAGGWGLTSMRDRIGAVGGVVMITSRPNRGAVVRGTVPVADVHLRPAASMQADRLADLRARAEAARARSDQIRQRLSTAARALTPPDSG